MQAVVMPAIFNHRSAAEAELDALVTRISGIPGLSLATVL